MADQNSNEPRFAIISGDFIDNLINTSIPDKTKKVYTIKTIRPLGLMDYEFEYPMGCLLVVHSSSRSNC